MASAAAVPAEQAYKKTTASSSSSPVKKKKVAVENSGKENKTRRRFSLFRRRRDSNSPKNNQQQSQQQSNNSRQGPRFSLRRKSAPAASTSQQSNNNDPSKQQQPSDSDENPVQRVVVVLPTTGESPEDATETTLRTEQSEGSSEDAVLSQQLQNQQCQVLHHSYLELLCGDPSTRSVYDLEDNDDNNINNTNGNHNILSEDPTVLESFECVFEQQLQEGLPYKLLEEEEGNQNHNFQQMPVQRPVSSPTYLHQSLQKSRSSLSSTSSFSTTTASPPTRRLTKQRSVSLRHVESASTPASSLLVNGATNNDIATEPNTSITAPKKCFCHNHSAPVVPPNAWPQGPLLVRPTPRSGMRIKGIRFSSSSEADYLWTPNDTTCTWPRRLAEHWNRPPPKSPLETYTMCPQCIIIPMNNGNEPEGEALVTDYESDLFEGSMLLRMRYSEGTTREPYDDSKGYFTGVNRRYQVVMRGRFKKAIDWTEYSAGLQLERPVTNLPPKYVVKGALKVISFFAPQLRAQFNGPRPHSLTPLGSTPQSLRVTDTANANALISLEGPHCEPLEATETLLGKASTQTSSFARARVRKKAIDKLVSSSTSPHNIVQTDPHKIYTMEFLQHLFQASDFTIQLGPLLGQLELMECLDGQPLQILALHNNKPNNTSGSPKKQMQHAQTKLPTPLWSFDVWHEGLYERAQQVDAGR